MQKRVVPNPVDDWVSNLSQGKSHISLELEQELIKVYQDEDSTPYEKQEAASTLLAYNATSLASIVLNLYYSSRGASNMEFVDLLQEAAKVFLLKLDTFDPSYGTRLITYYVRDVRTSLQRYISSNALAVRQGSVYLQRLAARIAATRRRLIAENNGNKPSNDEVAQELSITTRTINAVDHLTSISIVGADLIVDDNSGTHQYDIDDNNLVVMDMLYYTLSSMSISDVDIIYSCLVAEETIPSEVLRRLKSESKGDNSNGLESI